ncbi:MAG: hypothetical protein G3M70_11685 [Candidatus Nitronauta litoralis]|uniref:Cytochrome c-552/4 domain-containing protein n=1 Tax=Candidatus Nitronauta litoralis TaxID=2705533 RepID=A0A7T0G0K5_9BACT|nr:MAG: hypothetical protein G3M70_11685 [Candidatus Nitronauta litoralis]
MKLNLTITRPVLRILLVSAVSVGVFTGMTMIIPWEKNTGIDVALDLTDYSMPWTNNSPFYPSEWKTEGDKLIDWRGVPSATFCAECHEKEYKEWASSIHAITGPDVLYENTITKNELGSEHGGDLATEKVRWCDGCHEPLGILAGEGTPLPIVGPNEALEEGTTCIVCHTAVAARPLIGNGALTVKFNEMHRYLDPALIMAAPEEHAKAMQAKSHNPLMGKSDLCGSCHTEIRPTRVNGNFPMHLQETFDEWRLSDYAEEGIQCQDCHMHPDPGEYVESLKRGERPKRVVSHRFVGVNYVLTAADRLREKLAELRGGWVPGRNVFITGDEWLESLQKQQDLIVKLLKSAGDIKINPKSSMNGNAQLDVVVTNTGAGHYLPTGVLDQRHMWIEVIAKNADDKVVYNNGWFDDKKGEIDPEAAIYIKRLVNDDGSANTRHVLFDARGGTYERHPIRPKESDTVPYNIPLPPGFRGPLKVEAKLWYRMALQDLLKNTKEYQDPPLSFDIEEFIVPRILMVETSTEMEVFTKTASLKGGKGDEQYN